MRKAGPFDRGKFQAEKTATITQHTMRLTQGLRNVRDVADAKGNCVGIKMRVGEGQRLCILRRPDEAVDTALHGAFHADIQHVFVNVGNSDLRA